MPKRTPTEPIPASIQLLTVQDLARALRCSTWSIWAWSEAGIIPRPIMMKGGKRYWRVGQIEKMLDALERRTYVPPSLKGKAHVDLLAKLHAEEGTHEDEPPAAPRVKRSERVRLDGGEGRS